MRILRPTMLLSALAAGCLALAIAAGPAGAGTGMAGASAAPCPISKLVVWLPNGIGSGAAGSVFYKLRITNGGSAACTLTGFPGVRAIDLEGRPIGKPAAREAGRKAVAVNLAAGASASFQLRLVEPGNFSPADCHETAAAGLRVSPPGAGGARAVPLPFQTCAKPTEPVLTVGPVKKG